MSQMRDIRSLPQSWGGHGFVYVDPLEVRCLELRHQYSTMFTNILPCGLLHDAKV
jgi:hypothetical protein